MPPHLLARPRGIRPRISSNHEATVDKSLLKRGISSLRRQLAVPPQGSPIIL